MQQLEQIILAIAQETNVIGGWEKTGIFARYGTTIKKWQRWAPVWWFCVWI